MQSNETLPSIITAATLASLIAEQPGVRLLDVRTPGEFETVHIPGAYNVPLDTLTEHTREIRTVTDAQIVVVCQSGQRAGKAESALRSAGMSNLHLLEGGMNAWTTSGFEVVRGRRRMSLERQVRIIAGGLAAIGGILALFANPLFALLPAVMGSGLVFAGITDTCTLAMLLSKLGYNRPAACDPAAAVRALAAGVPPDTRKRAA